MTDPFKTVEDAVAVPGDPSNALWADAFRFLCDHPETAREMLETFQETLAQMGVEPCGVDPATGEPGFRLEDVAPAMGVPTADLDRATGESESNRDVGN